MEGWNLTGTSSGSFIDFANAMADSEAAGQSAVGKDADALSVSQAVEMAANALDAIPQLTVIGEVTGFRGPNARSGHCYFQIKDDASAVDCKIWRGVYSKRAFDLRDGLQVQFTGSFDLYKPTGRMSFIARSFSLAGRVCFVSRWRLLPRNCVARALWMRLASAMSPCFAIAWPWSRRFQAR